MLGKHMVLFLKKKKTFYLSMLTMYTWLKGSFTQKIKFCHLLTLMSKLSFIFWTQMLIFLN